MAADALAFHLEGLAVDGQAAPDASTLEEIMVLAENRDGVAVLIEAPATEVEGKGLTPATAKRAKVNVNVEG